MKARPILYQGAMVRALLDGSKTQTRRVFKAERITFDANGRYTTHAMRSGELFVTGSGPFVPGDWLHYCPYGQPGDQLWVREAWDFLPDGVLADGTAASQPNQAVIRYWADTSLEFRDVPLDFNPMIYNREKVRPSIHMPRWASRITLEIARVRVERLQDISEADAIAEGIARQGSGWRHYGSANAGECMRWAKNSYRSLWESINGPGSWDANPWVWAMEFKVVKPC